MAKTKVEDLTRRRFGRLIDADALADVFRGFIAMYDSCPFSQLSLPDKARRDELQAALAEVINAPTIIDAEELKKWFCDAHPYTCSGCPFDGIKCSMLDWLRQEASDD